MRKTVGVGLASATIGSVFVSALMIALTGSRSLPSDIFAALAVITTTVLMIFRRFYPPPEISTSTISSEDKTAAFTTWAALFAGGFSLILIYKGAFSDHRQVVAIGSCVMSALGAAMIFAEHMHQRRELTD